MQPEVKYRFYATLLDAYQNFLDSDKIWEKYWAWAENPPYTEEEFMERQYWELIDRINRCSVTTEAAKRGTVFNAIIDTLVIGFSSQTSEIVKVTDVGENSLRYTGWYNGTEFSFDPELCKRFAGMFEGGIPQLPVSALLETGPGTVELYGYIDYLMPQSIHDLKTTSRYSAGKYKSGWQHLVYPYCLIQEGMPINQFEYDIAELDGSGRWQAYVENYSFDYDRDVPRLKRMCEDFIRFIEENRSQIIDRKIFALPPVSEEWATDEEQPESNITN